MQNGTENGNLIMNTELSAETTEVALRELNILIEETTDDDPDPLTDDIFRARDELQAAVDDVTV